MIRTLLIIFPLTLYGQKTKFIKDNQNNEEYYVLKTDNSIRHGDYRKYGQADKMINEFVEQNERKWRSQVFKNNNGLIVISGTHPSIADWTKSQTVPSPMVKRYLLKVH